MPHTRATFVLSSLLCIGVAAACSGSGTEPDPVEFEVIEEVEFAPSLGIDLSVMTKLGSGVYYQDLVVGSGDTLTFGALASVDYTGWLRTGVQFDRGEGFRYVTGNFEVIQGFEQGMIGMMEGGTRKLIVPPALGYGANPPAGIPPGAILVFEVTLTDIL